MRSYPVTIIMLLLIIIFSAGAIWLQVFLSKRENKLLGLILPAITFVFSILNVLSNINRVDIQNGIISMIPIIIISNILTLVLLIIYFTCRRKMSINSQMNKMNIKDL